MRLQLLETGCYRQAELKKPGQCFRRERTTLYSWNSSSIIHSAMRHTGREAISRQNCSAGQSAASHTCVRQMMGLLASMLKWSCMMASTSDFVTWRVACTPDSAHHHCQNMLLKLQTGHMIQERQGPPAMAGVLPSKQSTQACQIALYRHQTRHIHSRDRPSSP